MGSARLVLTIAALAVVHHFTKPLAPTPPVASAKPPRKKHVVMLGPNARMFPNDDRDSRRDEEFGDSATRKAYREEVLDAVVEKLLDRLHQLGLLKVCETLGDGLTPVNESPSAHESSSLVDGQELDTPATVANTVGDTPDAASLGLGGERRGEPETVTSTLAEITVSVERAARIRALRERATQRRDG